MTLKPFMEQVVSDYAMEMIDEDESLCGCPRHRQDVADAALNEVKLRKELVKRKERLNE